MIQFFGTCDYTHHYSANHMWTLKFKWMFNMEKRGNVYSFECGAVVGVMVLMTTVEHHLMATASRTIHHGPNLLTSGHCTPVASIVTTSPPSRASLGFAGTGDAHDGGAANKSAATAWCSHFKMAQNLWGAICPKGKWIQPSLIKWPVSVYLPVTLHLSTSARNSLPTPAPPSAF